ncbi:MAG: AAA family ATPase [Bacteroidales bacterium]|jgi:dephospho-CoA kinase|nr:AAA family ATPase [Bacteroidales bacterium]
MIIIGITGTLGAGKGTIVDYLVKQKNLAHYSVRQYLIREMEKLGMPNNRDSMTILANRLRAENSPSFITDELYKEALINGKTAIIESIRTPGEIESLRSKGKFFLFAVDADSKTRYKRIIERASETDNISYETFLANEAREMNSTDPNKQNLKKCISMADFVFDNNGNLAFLYQKVEQVISKIIA